MQKTTKYLKYWKEFTNDNKHPSMAFCRWSARKLLWNFCLLSKIKEWITFAMIIIFFYYFLNLRLFYILQSNNFENTVWLFELIHLIFRNNCKNFLIIQIYKWLLKELVEITMFLNDDEKHLCIHKHKKIITSQFFFL